MNMKKEIKNKSKYRYIASFLVIDPNDNCKREEEYFTGKTMESALRQFNYFISTHEPYNQKDYLIRDINIFENPDYKEKQKTFDGSSQLSLFD